ncbi:hypothetical protein [Limnoglobus roseus]|uniref:Uncharacterized protein n=1 Tax=Limnoglobus roseus TaxID=2598579 RepID=A0A5C1AKQ9_9BACT|nr:hypothetical protein [Limnoglobus roseus]QEL18302.1 hypothetical protein PX52LOC_05323 [Limnoglobus roseus]
MPTAPADTAPLTLRACKGVEVFTTAGLSPDQDGYTPDQLRQAVENFYLLGEFRLSLLDPPLGIGHDDDQDVLTALLASDPRLAPYLTAASLDGDDGPAAGWITGLKVVPDRFARGAVVLIADFKDIPAPIADLIDARAYKRVSVEIYNDFVDGLGNHYGFALRRVALCGWAPPVNKAMADVPLTIAQFAEPKQLAFAGRPRTANAVKNTFTCFSEMRPMNKAQMLAALKGKFTLSDAAANAMSDAEVVAIYKKFSEPTPPAPVPPVAPPVQKMDEGAPPRDQMIAELQAAGQDAAQLAALDDQTLATVYAQWKAQQTPAPAVPAAMMAEVKKYSEQAKTLVTTLTIAVATAKTQADNIKRYAEETVRTQKAGKIAAARLDLIGANGVAHCTPAEFDTLHKPTLESLDDLSVQKFSEGNRSFEGTAFANYVAKLKALPAKKVFSEKLPAGVLPGGGDPTAAIDAEVNKVRAFAETHETEVKAFGLTKDGYVKRFTELKAKVPDLTAEKYTRQSA